ncbi:putative Transcription factor domain-containing protein [Seiridium unicorne]|uniref:Transcription factor domain-containing protein n=1 Tax=Seiridium unicorne TaxID=138068 RepID=A0ABR2UJV7_9PEZI
MRCVKAKRPCSGYEDGEFSAFRQYGPHTAEETPPFPSSARRCGLPKRVPIPGTDVLPDDDIPPETSESQSNSLALRAFFYDYCVNSTNQDLSRGFLSRLEVMARRLGPSSDLVKACQAVSFASHGKPLNRPAFVRKAERFYHELLGALAKAIENPTPANADEARLIAMLLGLFQMTVASHKDYGNHDIHAKGLAALMKVGYLPLDLLRGDGLGSFKHFQVSGVFSVPSLRGSNGNLDDLLNEVDSLWAKKESSYNSNDIHTLMDESIDLDHRLAKWQHSRVSEFQPVTVGYVGEKHNLTEIPVGYWPGKVDTYFDLYVAGVWNIYRSARLLLMVLMMSLSGRLDRADSSISYVFTAQQMFEDMIASIPYHLTDNLPEFMKDSETGIDIADPGRSLGGLLLMHPLYVAANVPFLAETERRYMRDCLMWIGSAMGLGQAALLAQNPDIDRDYLTSGFMIIWSGFLS